VTRKRTAPAPPDAMTAAELYAYYKRTAPVDDIRFAIRVGVDLSPELTDEWLALLEDAKDGLPASECRWRLWALQDRWRAERLAAEQGTLSFDVTPEQPEAKRHAG
jgi:hypothetical protein